MWIPNNDRNLFDASNGDKNANKKDIITAIILCMILTRILNVSPHVSGMDPQKMVGARGFEPPTPRTPSVARRRPSFYKGFSVIPNSKIIYIQQRLALTSI